jgi:hypothetical protein
MPLCPTRRRNSLPVDGSQRRMTPSADPFQPRPRWSSLPSQPAAASILPSGEYAIAKMGCVWRKRTVPRRAIAPAGNGSPWRSTAGGALHAGILRHNISGAVRQKEPVILTASGACPTPRISASRVRHRLLMRRRLLRVRQVRLSRPIVVTGRNASQALIPM